MALLVGLELILSQLIQKLLILIKLLQSLQPLRVVRDLVRLLILPPLELLHGSLLLGGHLIGQLGGVVAIALVVDQVLVELLQIPHDDLLSLLQALLLGVDHLLQLLDLLLLLVDCHLHQEHLSLLFDELLHLFPLNDLKNEFYEFFEKFC